MSYLALARKWRPKTFADVVGQEHIVRALANALETERVHHAYLFAGTRGVGKTTVARILAKALNCERGVKAEPCGECSACVSIDEGRFVDLIEVDAASKTKVDDTRELLENVQYTPTVGRYKVYLIDEVHMLSRHSFNALLKTLEEPPPHVKFLLATTDPQNLPVTILSRCLQFSLKRLTTSQIVDRMAHIAKAEKFKSDTGALTRLGRAANGSMRDALSLLDQALAFGDGRLADAEVADMLGSIDQRHISDILHSLANSDAAALMAQLKELHALVVDYASVLDDLATTLQQIAVLQLAGAEAIDEDTDPEVLEQLAAQLSDESVQLYYEIAIHGRRDLGLAPDPRIGFEMTLLRMLAFRQAGDAVPPATAAGSAPAKAAVSDSAPQSAAPVASQPNTADWGQIISGLGLQGAVRQLAEFCSITDRDSERLCLQLPASAEYLLTEQMQQKLVDTIKQGLGVTSVELQIVAEEFDTLAGQATSESANQLRAAEDSIANDPNVQELMDVFGAKIDSIKPVNSHNGQNGQGDA